PTHFRYYSFPRHRIFFLGGERGDQRRGAIEVACVNGQLNQPLRAPHRSHRRVFQDRSSFLQVTQAESAIRPVKRDDVVVRRKLLNSVIGEVFSFLKLPQGDKALQKLDGGEMIVRV